MNLFDRIVDQVVTILMIFFVLVDSLALIQLPAYEGRSGDQVRILAAGIALALGLFVQFWRRWPRRG